MDITLKVENQNLAATLFKPEGFKKPLPAFIFIHGWKSNRQGNNKRAAEISKLGFICLTLDLRGHGDSATPTTSLREADPSATKQSQHLEDYSRQDHLEDIKAAYKYLENLPEVNKNKIGIVGSSYGGYLSAVAANELEFEWLVLRVPALYFDDNFKVPTNKLINEDPQAFKTSNLKTQNTRALKGVANFPGEILIIESEKDTVIPHPVIENYLEAIEDKRRLTYIVMKNAPHSLETEAQEKEYIEVLKTWLSEKSKELEIEV